MGLEERIDRLESAHRALAAQHMALQTTCRIMLPIIPADPDTVRRLLASALDITREQMAASQLDDAFQADVRHWLEVIAKAIEAGLPGAGR